MQAKKTVNGMMRWANRKKINNVIGSEAALTKSFTCKRKEPDRVISANMIGIKGRRLIKTFGNKNPINTPVGVKIGMSFSRREFNDIAISFGDFFEFIIKFYHILPNAYSPSADGLI